MESIRPTLSRVRGKVAFPVLAAAMGLSTLVTGLDHASFLRGESHDAAVSATAQPAVPAFVSPLATRAPAQPEPSSYASLNTGLEHQRIDDWVRRLTTSAKGEFQQSLDRMDRYADMITARLDARGMPRELIYLALIESNFNPTAKSRVSAVGLWQFMGATARQFGLAVERGRDERKDPAKATDAALSYLSTLHDRFGSWYLAAAAYNSGQGTVSKALRKVTGRTTGTDADFFRIMAVLPKETQNYVPKLIASARVGSNPEQYGLN